MNTLAELQRSFLQSVLQGTPLVQQELAAHGGIAPGLGLDIYIHAYHSRLREALANDHAVLATYLGDELWQALCTGYIRAHPSHYRSLRYFGIDLPRFVATTQPFASHPVLCELAAFERALLDSFDAADAGAANWAALQSVPANDWPMLSPRLVPSLRRLSMRFNSVQIWTAMKAGQVPPTLADAAANEWVTWRDCELLTRFRSVDVTEAAALDHVLAGGDFAGLCELLQAWHAQDEVPAAALQLLSRWSGEGWIASWS
ncbi:MAG: HvfC/BufC family peptide modification chaperone [Arenimonas sp.]